MNDKIEEQRNTLFACRNGLIAAGCFCGIYSLLAAILTIGQKELRFIDSGNLFWLFTAVLNIYYLFYNLTRYRQDNRTAYPIKAVISVVGIVLSAVFFISGFIKTGVLQ